MNTYAFIIVLLLIFIAVTGAFLVGFALGDYRLNIEPAPPEPKRRKKSKPPDDGALKKEIEQLHKLNAEIEKYDGGGVK